MKYCDISNRYQRDSQHVLSEEDAIAAQLHGDADQPDQKVIVTTIYCITPQKNYQICCVSAHDCVG